jgi:hypothetical protein
MYRYYNQNPNGYHIPDCVIRAISLAMGISYYEVISLLHLNAERYNCDELCVCCYEKLLDFDFDLPHYYGNGNTAQEVALDFPENILLLRMSGHLSCSIRGEIWDIWNCSDEIITDFWIVDYC